MQQQDQNQAMAAQARSLEVITRDGRRVPCDEQGHWHSGPADDLVGYRKRAHGIFRCTACLDGCAHCGGTTEVAYFLGDSRDVAIDEYILDHYGKGSYPMGHFS